MSKNPWLRLKFFKYHWPQVLSNIQNYNGVTIPHRKHLFKALKLTRPEDVKVVILGQEPYTTNGWSDGLAFSVHPHVYPYPKTLDNIFAEYTSDLGFRRPKTGSLEPWANNGVLLLNSILTVGEGRKLSHAGFGWEKLTYECLRFLSDRGGCVFLLWGKRAQSYSKLVATGLKASTNLVLPVAHPSPMSARQGFFGSRPFSRANEFLEKIGREKVNWRLP